jgi:hypothetical protein
MSALQQGPSLPPPPPGPPSPPAEKRGVAVRIWVLVVGGIVLLGVIAAVASTGDGDVDQANASRAPTGALLPSPDELLGEAPSAAAAAGCDDVTTVGPYKPRALDQAHAGYGGHPLPPLSTFPSVPPTSGPHNPVPLPAGIYGSAPPIDHVLHSLEHGAAIIWYDPSVPGEELDRLREFYRDYRITPEGSAQGAKIIIAPYDYPDEGEAGRLPLRVHMALTAWHRLQTCADVSLSAAFDFTSQYVVPPFENRTYKGEAPEPQSPINPPTLAPGVASAALSGD